MEDFKTRLKHAIKYRNIKQNNLADKIGCSKSLITRYIKGQTNAKQDNLNLISEVLQVSPAWLLGYDVPMTDNTKSNLSEVIKSIIDSMSDDQLEKLKIIIDTMFVNN